MGIVSIAGGVIANASASGGKVYAYNTITNTTPTTVAPANPQRRSIVFHNPGTVDIFIGPALAFTTSGGATPTALTPTTAALGGTWRVFGNGGSLTLTGECQGAWQALALSGGAVNPLTVMDSNT